MIKISKTSNEREVCIEVRGHANYGPKGQDIVCAAISVLYQTMIKTIMSLHGDVKCGGNNQIQKVIIRNPGEKELLLVDSFLLGCAEVSKVFPNNVQV